MSHSPGLHLLNRALQELHPSWLPQYDPELLQRARRSQIGRRWLARQLRTQSVSLASPFDPAGQVPTADLREFAEPMAACDRLLLELGANSVAAELGLLVTRRDVSRVRRLLGERLYGELLQSGVAVRRAPTTQEINVWHTADDHALQERLEYLGYVELSSRAQRLHALIGERVRLAFPRNWAESRVDSHLADESVDLVLSRCVSRQQESADD